MVEMASSQVRAAVGPKENTRQAATISEQQGDALLSEGKWEAASEFYEAAAKQLESFLEPMSKSRVEAKIGESYYKRREYEIAIKHFKKQLDHAELCKDRNEKIEASVVALHNIGAMLFFRETNNEDQALETLEKSLRLHTELSPQCQVHSQYARTESCVGAIYQARGEFEEALIRHRRDLKASRKVSDPEGILRALLNTAVCLMAQNDYTKAYDLLSEANSYCLKEYHNANQANNSLSTSVLPRVWYLLALVEPNQAETYLQKAADTIPRIPENNEDQASTNSSKKLKKIKGASYLQDWPGTLDDALLAVLIHLEICVLRLEEGDNNIQCSSGAAPDTVKASIEIEIARSYLRIATALLNETCCGASALLEHAIQCTLGRCLAMKGELKAAQAAYELAITALDRAENAGKFSGGAKEDGSIELCLFTDRATRRQAVRALKAEALRGQAVCFRAAIGMGDFGVGGAKAATVKTLKLASKTLDTAIELLYNTDKNFAGVVRRASSTLLASSPTSKRISKARNRKVQYDTPETHALASSIFGHRGSCRQLTGLKADAFDDFESQQREARNSALVQPQISAIQSLIDSYDLHGDYVAAIGFAKKSLRLAHGINDHSGIAHSARRLINLYCTVASDPPEYTSAPETITVTKLESIHPRELDQNELDIQWIAHNARVLAKYYLRIYKKHSAIFNVPQGEDEVEENDGLSILISGSRAVETSVELPVLTVEENVLRSSGVTTGTYSDCSVSFTSSAED